jgi:type III pantothenate kinase
VNESIHVDQRHPTYDLVAKSHWLALVIGNSRLHWAGFAGDSLAITWDTPHVSAHQIEAWLRTPTHPTALHQTWPDSAIAWLWSQANPILPIWIASVVPAQYDQWSGYPQLHQLALTDISLQGTYPTLGIDRALALWGAGQRYGFPHLVIDAGTALTFTGADADATLIGGAILPGLRTQFQSLVTQTAQLPTVEWPSSDMTLPQRWAVDTETAIASGILHSTLAGIRDFIQDWRQRYPNSGVTLTGGDADYLWTVLHQRDSHFLATLQIDSHLVFWGILSAKIALISTSPRQHHLDKPCS